MNDRIEKTVDLKAPVDRVWRAITDHREFGQWFRVRLDGPFVLGEASTGNMTYPGYEHLPWEATVVKMDAPSLFAFTWPHFSEDPKVDTSKEPPTLVEFKLEPIADGTRLTIVESGFDALPEGRRAEAWRMNEGGWSQQIRNIQTHVER